MSSEDTQDVIDDAEKLPGEVRQLSLDQIRENDWNPQEMTDDEFNLLAESMQEGMVDPIQVVPLENDPRGAQFMILGGEHRWKVADTLGWKTIPAIVLTDEKFRDEELQKFWTVKLNVLRGKLNPEKFLDLYNEMIKRHDHASLQHLFGFTESDKFDKLVGGVKEGLKAAGLSKEMQQEFSEVVEEMKTVDDLSNILNRLFTKYGDDLKYNFIVLSFGNRDHMYIKCDKPLWKKAKDLASAAREHEIRMTDVLNDLFDEAKRINLKKYDKVKDEVPDHFEASV